MALKYSFVLITEMGSGQTFSSQLQGFFVMQVLSWWIGWVYLGLYPFVIRQMPHTIHCPWMECCNLVFI